MPDALSPNLAYLKPSETVAIGNETKRRRAAGEDVIDLSVGEPDFDTPRAAAEAGEQAIEKGMTHYPANIGIVELRAAIARNMSLMSGGRAINADQIETPLFLQFVRERAAGRGVTVEEQLETYRKRNLMGASLIPAETVADLAVLLASEKFRYTTGGFITVDGGLPEAFPR